MTALPHTTQAAPDGPAADTVYAFPCSYAQEGLWLADRLSPGTAAYNVPAALRLRGPLAADALAAALQDLVDRHEALRTTFGEVDHAPVQFVHERLADLLDRQDLTDLPPGKRDAQALRLARQEAARGFDLTAGPLLRARLLKLGDDHHVLLLTLHHIVADGWSVGVILRELGEFFRSRGAGAEARLPDLPLQYADYAVWHRDRLDAAERTRLLDHWRSTPVARAEPLELPWDHPRPAEPTGAGNRAAATLTPELTGALRELAQRHGVSLFMVLAAAYATVLHRHSGQTDIVLGTPVANRGAVDTEALIGYFVNVLPIAVDLAGAPAFTDLIGRVRSAALDAFAHQDLPFDMMVEALCPDRDRRRSPLFQAMFALQNASAEPVALPGLDTELLDVDSGTAKYDVSLLVEERAGGLHVVLETNADVVAAAGGARLLDQWRQVLEAVSADPATPVTGLPRTGGSPVLAGPAEETLPGGGAPAHDVAALVADRARTHPARAAVTDAEHTLTYAALDEAADRIAHALRARGVRPGQLVALRCRPSATTVAAVLGIWRAGAAYVPVDLTLPAQRAERILAACGAAAVLTGRAWFAAGTAEPGALAVEDLLAEEEPAGGRAPLPPLDPHGLAYVLYTSGSTGAPKGVMIPHDGLARYVGWATAEYAVADGSGAPVHSPLGFDLTLTSLLTPLAAGRTAVLVDSADGVEQLTALLSRQSGFSLLKITPAHLELLERTLAPELLAKAAGTFVVGGEALSPALVQRIARTAPGVRIVNEYGPTETVVGCCVHTVTPEDASAVTVPIGTPVPGTRLYVLDEALRPVPDGVPGELFIAGGQVGWGYLGAPGQTAERFLPDPYGAAGERMYRSGDLVRRLPAGSLEYLGRLDHQVKIRGFRIEPGEIEAALLAGPGISEACVVARTDEGTGPRLVAYAVPTDEAPSVDPAAVRARLSALLPAYMVPAAVVVLPALPLTGNGKVNRAALPAPGSLDFARPAHEEPREGTERTLAGIWSEVLGVELPGRADNFFDLDGHSLTATGVVSRIRERLGVDLPLRALFEAPTLASLAEAVDRLRTEDAPAAAPDTAAPDTAAAPAADAGRPDVLSFAQQRLWFLDQLDPGSPLYNVPAALRLTGRLDTGALTGALADLTTRHEALRTGFPADADGTGRPSTAAEVELPLTTTDLSGLEADARAQEWARLAARAARTRFDLARPPLWSAQLLTLADEDHILLVTVHHIISDGWSVGVLLRDLAELYRSRLDGTPARLPELRSRYADHARHLRDALDSGALDGQLAHWRERLAGPLPLLDLPSDRPRSAGPRRGAELLRDWDATLTRDVERFSKEHGVTPFVTLLSAFHAFLHRHTGQTDVIVGSPVAGRTRQSTEDLAGCFVNVLPLRASVTGDLPFDALLRHVRERAVEAYDHQDVPFERLVEETGTGRDQTRTPLFQVMFGLQNTPAAELALPGLAVTDLPVHSGTSRFDLTVLLEPRDGALRLRLEYDSGLFDAATAELFAQRYEALLRGALARPASPVGELPAMAAEEEARMAAGPGATDVPFPVDRTFRELFDAQVARIPDAVAAVDASGSVTYAALHDRAARCAAALRAAGLRPGERVALLAERSTHFLTAVLGVFMAGGAYVPLDPMYPTARLARILTGSGAALTVHTRGTRALLDAVTAAGAPAGRTLALEDALAAPLPWPAPAPVQDAPDDLAYVIFTSGSTGVPKGAMVEQAGMVNHLWAKIHDIGMTDGDTLVQNASVCFDISVWQFLAPLLLGGRVVIVTDEQAHDPALLWAAARDHGATLLESVPSMLRAALADPALPETPALRLLMLTGEALDPVLVRAWLARHPAIPVVNAYGPTECSDDVTHATLTTPPAPYETRTPIGLPVPNMRLYVCDPHGRPLPAGVPGELYVGGIGVGRGYLDDPAMTAQRFLPDPFGPRPGARLYRTGDLVRLRADGALEFLGRIDHQVKIRGHRMELGEVEAALARHPAVRDCAAAACPDPSGELRLVGYVVGDDLPPARDLRGHLTALLGEHMTPGHFVTLDALPLNPNGKVDRKALPTPDWGAAGTPRTRIEPRDATEEAVTRVWADVLGLHQGIGVTDDFFDLGGHSLLAVRAVAALRTELGKDIPLRTLFDASVAEDFAAAVRTLSAAPAAAELPVTAPGGREELSSAQQRMWFFEQRTPGTHVLNMSGAYRIRGPLDPARFAAALTATAARHDTLRTVYASQDGTPHARVLDPVPVELPLYDLRDLPPARREERLADLAAAESTHVFDLAAGPVLRTALARLDDAEWVLFVTVHHLAADGGSVVILLEETLRAYAGAEAVEQPGGARYADWARHQSTLLDGPAGRELAAYWRDALAGDLPVLTLPADRPRTAQQTFEGSLVAATVPAPQARRLRELSRRSGTTLFMTLLAGFQATLQRLTGERDVIIGTPVDGRSHTAVQRTVGCFVNTLPIRTDVDPEAGFSTLLGRVRTATVDAFAHQDLPFERIVAEVCPDRDRSTTPLFQVLFNMLDPEDPLAGHPADGLDVQPYGARLLRFGAKFDLSLYVRDRGDDGLELTAVHNSLIFDDARISDLLERFTALLEAATAAPDSPLAGLAPAPTRLDAALPDPAEPLPAQWAGGLLERLSLHAAQTPDAVAADDGTTRWTYRRLAAGAAAGADLLTRHGVGAGDVVAVLAHRSAALPAAVLAVLRTGAAFLLLDPDHPAEVLRRRTETAGARIVLVPGEAAPAAPVPDRCTVLTLPSTPSARSASSAPDDAPPAAGAGPAEDPDAVAYLAFTSGSTGQPRAVAGTQRALTHFLDWHTRHHGLGRRDRVAALSGPSHDPFLRDLFTPLWCGGTLLLTDPATVRDPDRLARWLGGQEISVIHLTPSLGRLLGAAAPDLRLPALRRAFFGGEALSTADCRELALRAPGVRCTAFYGATETPQAMGVQDVDPGTDAGPAVPLGRGIPGVQLLVLAPDGRRAGLGELGEIAVRTPYLALGYPHDPELTAARFVPGPGGDRAYLTGDLGRHRPDGTVEYAGRADRQLKVRGHRVDPRETEARLAEHTGVAHAHVVAAGPDTTHAHVVPGPDGPPTAAELADWCRQALPDHLVPGGFTFHDRLPLTANGKVDEAALRAQAEPAAPPVAPRTDVEAAVHAIWREVLPGREFGVEDDFFAVGGHSLAAAQVLARLRQAFELDLDLAALFDATTVAALAALVEARLQAELDALTDDEIAALLSEDHA
ncbi:amino acid adenylation domain-containing protein [Streptomyces sp. NPDC059957]|uniref:non-ribosomal peptide synthetase n=1 Tax=Streptomyces sp. NPDC059957 TaxID=3347016 RepID=UPI003646F385